MTTRFKKKVVPLTQEQQAARLLAANRMFNTFFQRSQTPAAAEISVNLRGRVCVSWLDSRSQQRITRQWLCRGQDFYPVWKRHYPGGGTSVTALSQLVYWVQNKPVFPIGSWYYWATSTVALVTKVAVDQLLADGYPEHVNCVLCDQPLERGMDWWSLRGVHGPCHTAYDGCKQRPVLTPAIQRGGDI